jgi:ABC-type nitrate/sulfonate/bicarbonate transport system permease component
MLDCYSRWRTDEVTASPDFETGDWSSNSWQVLTVDTMYVGLLVIAVLGFVFSLVLDEIERMLIPWKANA